MGCIMSKPRKVREIIRNAIESMHQDQLQKAAMESTLHPDKQMKEILCIHEQLQQYLDFLHKLLDDFNKMTADIEINVYYATTAINANLDKKEERHKTDEDDPMNDWVDELKEIENTFDEFFGENKLEELQEFLKRANTINETVHHFMGKR